MSKKHLYSFYWKSIDNSEDLELTQMHSDWLAYKENTSPSTWTVKDTIVNGTSMHRKTNDTCSHLDVGAKWFQRHVEKWLPISWKGWKGDE